MTLTRTTHNCSCGATTFKVLSGIVILEVIFLVSTSFVFLKDYITNVRSTYSPSTSTFTIRKEYFYLYLSEAISTSIFLIYIIFLAVWLLKHFAC